MSRVLALLLVTTVLAGCAGDGPAETASTPVTTSTPFTTTTPATTTPVTTTPVATTPATTPNPTPNPPPSPSPTPDPPAPFAVAIQGFAFSPRDANVPVGTTVTWTNHDASAHTATADGGEFDSSTLGMGASASHQFTKTGTFAYHCAFHPGMRGTVTVS